MRNFDDAAGGHWQAAVLDGSYGGTLLVFSCAGDGAVRKTAMSAQNRRLAEQDLAGMSESRLRELLAESVPWA